MTFSACTRFLLVGAWLILTSSLAIADAAGPPVPTALTPITCDEPDNKGDAVIDKVHHSVYGTVCGAATWFDSLFGNPRFDRDSGATYGRTGVFESFDRRDGLETQLELRARVALPALKDRLNLTFNRDTDEDAVDERPSGNQKPVPQSFRTVNDEAWLLGLGYSRRGVLEDGFDFGIGVRLGTPLDPYVKTTYRHYFVFTPSTGLLFRETPFWRNSRSFGETTELTLDHLLKSDVLLRWNAAGTVAGDTEGLKWGTNVVAYQDLRQRSAMSYTVLLRGETGADVPIQNYGAEMRYRRQIFRKWLFMDVATSVTWPRETLDEQRQVNPGIAVGLEMYFGPVPDLKMR